VVSFLQGSHVLFYQSSFLLPFFLTEKKGIPASNHSIFLEVNQLTTRKKGWFDATGPCPVTVVMPSPPYGEKRKVGAKIQEI